MDRQLYDAAEQERSCRQFAAPITSLCSDVSLDDLSLPCMQSSSLWSYPPAAASYEQAQQSAWHPADRGECALASRADVSNRQINDLSPFQDLSPHWLEPNSTSAFVGDTSAAASFRTLDSFSVCDLVHSNIQSGELTSSRTKHTCCHTSPTIPDDFLASSDAELCQKFDSAQGCTSSYQGAKTSPALPGTTICYRCDIQSCDKLDCIPSDELRTVKSEFATVGNTTQCSCSDERFPSTCKLHSRRCASSAEELTEDCFDVHARDAVRWHHHRFYPAHHQPVFTNCHKTDFRSYDIASSQQSQSSACARQSASMNDLDIIDLPPHISSNVPTEMAENSVSVAAMPRLTDDIGSVSSAKPDSPFSYHLRTKELGEIDPESSSQATAKTKEKSRNDLNVQNCIKQDASTSLPSACPKLPSSVRKSKKKMQRAAEEKLRPVVTQRTACDVNLAATDGAIDNNLCAAASEHVDRTAHVNTESGTERGVAKDRTKSEKTTEHDRPNLTACVAECSDQLNADSVETEKLGSSARSRFTAESRAGLETQPSVRHHRRSAHKMLSSCPAQKEKSSRRERKKDRTRSFPLKRFLSSVDWYKLHRNIELAGSELAGVVWNVMKIIVGVICYEALLIVESIYQSVTDTSSVILGWLAEKYSAWKQLHHERSNSTSAVPQLSENIMLPSTGEEAVRRLFACKGKDPYSILGLRKDCTDEDIKKYYRRQAVLVHPDKNSELGAEEAFKILHHAFEMIGEPEKRHQYDMATAKELANDVMMQEFTDLLTKLHETIKETVNLMACSHCGGKHRRYPVGDDITLSAARYCSRCDTRHAVKDGDVWAESSVFGFRWHYYACMEGDVYNITEWASCQQEDFKLVKANSHFVMVHISTGSTSGNKAHHRPTPSEAELEELFNSVFAGMSAAAAAEHRKSDSFSSAFFPSPGTGNSATGTASKTQSSTVKKKRKKRR